MKKLLLAALLVASRAVFADRVVLSFDQIVSRVETAHAIPPRALEAASSLETPRPFNLPTLRAEVSASSADHVDLFAQNVFRFEALSALLSVDYPLLDGGLRDKELRLAQLDAETFRQRTRESAVDLYRETVDAVANLYSAQERLRVLNAGLQRAVAMRDRAKQLVASHEISNMTVAQWEDESIAAESQLLALQLQQLEAETHVKQLMGDTSTEPLEVVLDLTSSAPQPEEAKTPASTPMLNAERKQLELEEAEAARRPQLLASAFGGVAALGNTYGVNDRRRYALYGLRFSIALPMLDAAAARRVAEARLQAEQAEIEKQNADAAMHKQSSMLKLGISALEKRIDLLGQAVDVSKKREESVVRLVSAGIRSEAAVAEAAAERTKRETDLLGARVELWKLHQLLAASP